MPKKVQLVKAMVFSSSHVWMWELDYKESWVPKNWCFWNVVLEKTLESPLDSKEIQPVHPKGNQSWIYIGWIDAETETPILWPPDAKNCLIGKDPDAGKDWRQEEKGMTEDETVGWHHGLNGHEFEWTLAVGDGEGSLACCSPWGCKESDMTEQLHWTELNWRSGIRQACPLTAFIQHVAVSCSQNTWAISSVQSLSCVGLFATPWFSLGLINGTWSL